MCSGDYGVLHSFGGGSSVWGFYYYYYCYNNNNNNNIIITIIIDNIDVYSKLTFGLALGPIVIALKVLVFRALIKRTPEGHGIKALRADRQPLKDVDRLTEVVRRLCRVI